MKQIKRVIKHISKQITSMKQHFHLKIRLTVKLKKLVLLQQL